jgi:serine/threonine-protein kinase
VPSYDQDPLNYVNRTVGRYHITKYIGGGGMGKVYAAIDSKYQREVAIKFMPTDWVASADLRERFTREAEIIADLNHPNIVRLYKFDILPDGAPFIVMPYLKGGTLAEEELRRKTAFTLEQVLWVIPPIASALDYAHSKGVIHRDVKPGNILLDEHTTPYLGDFGISKMVGSVTITTSYIGTPPFMAPELWHNKGVSGSVDQYALAVVVWVMLTRRTPYLAETAPQMMYHHFQTPPPDLREANETIPAAVSKVVSKALSKNPADRYPTVTHFANALQTASKHHKPANIRTPIPIPPPHQTLPTSPPTTRPSFALPQTPTPKPTTPRPSVTNQTHKTLPIEIFPMIPMILTVLIASLFGIFVLLWSSGNSQSSITGTSTAFDLVQQQAEARSRCLSSSTDYPAVIAACTQVLQNQPQQVSMMTVRGNGYNNIEDYDAAIADFTQAIAINPSYARAYQSRCNTYINREEYDLALTDCDRAVNLDPNSALNYRERCEANLFLENYVAALEDCNRSAELNPDNALVYWIRAKVYYELEDTDAMIDNYRQYERLSGGLPSVTTSRIEAASG